MGFGIGKMCLVKKYDKNIDLLNNDGHCTVYLS